MAWCRIFPDTVHRRDKFFIFVDITGASSPVRISGRPLAFPKAKDRAYAAVSLDHLALCGLERNHLYWPASSSRSPGPNASGASGASDVYGLGDSSKRRTESVHCRLDPEGDPP